MTINKCLHCSAALSPPNYYPHMLHFHKGKMLSWACHSCYYTSDVLEHALIHCLLEGHQYATKSRLVSVKKVYSRVEKASTDGNKSISRLKDKTSSSRKKGPEREQIDDSIETTGYLHLEDLIEDIKPAITQPAKMDHLVSHEKTEMDTFDDSSDALESSLDIETDDDFETTKSAAAIKNQNRNGNKDSSQSDHLTSFKCSNCGTTIQSNRQNGRNSAMVNHAKSCCSIRPYSCSECDYQASQRTNVTRHFKSQCQSGNVVLANKEGTESAVRQAVKLCFPNCSFVWNGFKD